MGVSKKYYWLRFKNDFFQNKEVKKLRKIAGGDTYTIIYLKLQLLSINTEGVLKFERTESDFVEQLSLETDEKYENVKVVMNFLMQNKLIEELDGDCYLLPKVPPLIGKETDAATRMRKLRSKNKSNNVTPVLQNVTQRKEIELEIELEIDNMSQTSVKKQKDSTIDEVLRMVNKLLGKTYRITTKKYRQLVSARLDEGYKLEDFRKVVETKLRNWKGTEQEVYLRPNTLFAAGHFDDYLNENPIVKSKTTSKVSAKENFNEKPCEIQFGEI